jgi:Ca2+-binding RTX toxin-like protein
VNGDSGNDTIGASGGNDTLTGGSGDDLFVFGDSSGDDLITDFTIDEDTLDLSGTVTDFSDAASVTAAASNTAGGLLIDLGGGNSVLLEGLTTADIEDMALVL